MNKARATKFHALSKYSRHATAQVSQQMESICITFGNYFALTCIQQNQGYKCLFTQPHHTKHVDLLKRSLMQLSLSILDFSVILYDFSKFKTEIIHINPRYGTYT